MPLCVLPGGAAVEQFSLNGTKKKHSSNMLMFANRAKTVSFVHSNSLILWARCLGCASQCSWQQHSDLCLSELRVNNSAASSLSALSTIVLILMRTKLFLGTVSARSNNSPFMCRILPRTGIHITIPYCTVIMGKIKKKISSNNKTHQHSEFSSVCEFFM